MVALGAVNAGWNPGGSRISEKLSFLSDDSAVTSSEDMFTTVGRSPGTLRTYDHSFVLVLTLFIFKVPNYVLTRTLTERVV